MPNRNGTGPLGTGPMTGRGAGYCVGYDVAECDGRFGGRGMRMGGRRRARGRGQGFGGGGGRRNRFSSTGMSGVQGRATGATVIDDAQELDTLKEQLGYLEGVLDGIRQRMDELQKNDAE